VFVEDKVEASGYASVSEYIRELIRIDQRFELARLDTVVKRPPNSAEHARPVSREIDNALSRFTAKRPYSGRG